jgi:hypothetical protein
LRVFPGGLALAQLLRPLEARLQLLLRDGDLLDVEDLVVAERPVDGLVVDLHVGQQRERRLALELGAQRVDLLAQRLDARGELGLVGVGHATPEAGCGGRCPPGCRVRRRPTRRGEENESDERADRHHSSVFGRRVV